MSSSKLIIEKNKYYWVKLDTFPVWPVRVSIYLYLYSKKTSIQDNSENGSNPTDAIIINFINLDEKYNNI